MFIYFNQNKLAYHKGQLVPFFIAFIIVLLMTALVTVNIGKVGLIKTYSSNAADAGTLAGGSVMATVFNTQAVMNSELIVAYETFYASMAVSVGIIIAAMWTGSAGCAAAGCCGPYNCVCCPSSCGLGVGVAITGITGAALALIAFQAKQFFYYKTMKEQAIKGREDAIKAAYRYAFLNSGISSKLKGCQLEETGLCDDCEDGCERDCKGECGEDSICLDTCSREELTCLVNNCQSQQADFQLELKDVGSAPTAEYSWLDGQERDHKVHVGVETEEVGTYSLKVPLSPTAGLLTLLYLARAQAVIAGGWCNCCPLGEIYIVPAAKLVTIETLAVLAGLVPAWNFDASGFAMVMFPICWVRDIGHNRLLAVTTWQEHEGQDYGLMGQTEYPHIESYSQVDFRGDGDIDPPRPYFDATIIETDGL